MALITFRAEDRISYGELTSNGVLDLGRRLGAALPDLKSFLSAKGLGILSAPSHPNVTDYATGEFSYLPVIPNPSKILCVGLNYEEHRRETGRPVAKFPAIFTRFADTLVGEGAPILLPPNSTSLDWEGELAVVIGKEAFRVSEEDALTYVAGYSVFNDATIRDWQHHTHQFTPGKNFRGTGAFGPALLSADEVGDLADKRIETRVNDVVMQSAKLGDMLFNVAQIIAYLTGFTRLLPGDVIATGTPGGVGFKRDPQIFMRQGDRVDVIVEGVGTLNNFIECEAIPSAHGRH